VGFDAESAEGRKERMRRIGRRNRRGLRFEPEGDGYGDVGRDRLAVLASGLIAILFKGVHGGFVEGRRAGEDFHGFDVAGFINERVEGDIAGDEAAQGIGRSDRTNGLNQFGWNDGGIVAGRGIGNGRSGMDRGAFGDRDDRSRVRLVRCRGGRISGRGVGVIGAGVGRGGPRGRIGGLVWSRS